MEWMIVVTNTNIVELDTNYDRLFLRFKDLREEYFNKLDCRVILAQVLI